MDKNTILIKLNNHFPDLKLEAHRFGRSNVDSIWVESRDLLKVMEFFKADPDFRLEFLENLSVSEMDQVLVLSYFLTTSYLSSEQPFLKSLILRVSLILPDNEKIVVAPSVSHLYTHADVFEDEAGELFGILFEFKSQKNTKQKRNLLPRNWNGFPLRKSFQLLEGNSKLKLKKPKSEANQ